MTDFGFKASKDGYDVKTATTDQLAVTSAFLSEKVVSHIQTSHSHSGTSASTVITHNLGYIPQALVCTTSLYYFLPVIFGITTGGFTAYDLSMTSTTLTIRTTTNAATTFTDVYEIQLLYNSI
jgi:hypothetical protein